MARVASVATLQAHAIRGADFRRWYTDGVPYLRAMADGLGCSVELLADILAITSPQCPVARNFAIARDYIRRRAELATLDGAAIARALRHIPSVGAGLAHYERTGEIRGRKTGPFARALLGDPDALVLDTWMAKALGVTQAKLFTKAVYGKASTRIATVARRMGWTVAETQAAIWYSAIQTFPDSRGRRKYANPPTIADVVALAAK
jgi:hypothetical protein